MRRINVTQALILLIVTTLPGRGLAAFINEQLGVAVHAQPFAQGAKLATLQSGDSVKVLSSDGEYARILTIENLTGWIEAKYLSDTPPDAVDTRALEKQNRELSAQLQATKDTLATVKKAAPSAAELKKLRQSAKDIKWMRAELDKARNTIKTMEQAAESSQSTSADVRQELEQLKALNTDLEQRLAATLLINGQPGSEEGEMSAPPVPDAGKSGGADIAPALADAASENGWSFRPQWFLGSLLTAMIIGIVLGMVWMDRRMRRRHGGFRLY